jgi:hypothetical protein
MRRMIGGGRRGRMGIYSISNVYACLFFPLTLCLLIHAHPLFLLHISAQKRVQFIHQVSPAQVSLILGIRLGIIRLVFDQPVRYIHSPSGCGTSRTQLLTSLQQIKHCWLEKKPTASSVSDNNSFVRSFVRLFHPCNTPFRVAKRWRQQANPIKNEGIRYSATASPPIHAYLRYQEPPFFLSSGRNR